MDLLLRLQAIQSRLKMVALQTRRSERLEFKKITSGAGNFLTYAPSGTACSSGQVLELNGSGQWVCGNKTVDTDTNDNLGNHEATQNIDLNTFKLVGNNGIRGLKSIPLDKLVLGEFL